MMTLCIAGKHQCQCTVAGHVACSSEAVLQCKDGKHQCSAGAVEFQYSGNDAKGCHNSSAGDTGSADGEYTEKQTKQNHTSVRTEPQRWMFAKRGIPKLTRSLRSGFALEAHCSATARVAAEDMVPTAVR